MGAVKPVGQLSPTVLTKHCLARDRYFIYVIQTPSVKRRIFVEQKRPRYRNTGTTRGHGRPFFDVNTKFAADLDFSVYRNQTREHMKNRNKQSFLQVSLSTIIAQKQKNRILTQNASAPK